MARKKSKPNRPKRKAETPLVQARLDEVLQLRLDGAQRWDVCQFVSDREADKELNNWTLGAGEAAMSERQIDRYIRRADAIIVASREKSRGRSIARHLAMRRNLYAKAVLAGDVSAALAVLRDEARLLDLYPATRKKHEHSGPGGGAIPVAGGAITLTADDIAAARGLLGVEGCDVPPHGGPQPVGAG